MLSVRDKDDRTLFRRIQSQVYTTACWLLLGLPRTSPNAAFKLYRRELIASMPLQSTGWFLDTEIAYRLQRSQARISKVPIGLEERRFGTSTVTLGDALRIFLRLIEFWRSVRHEKTNH